MRWLLLLLALCAAGVAVHQGVLVRSPFSSYSREQLELLVREYQGEVSRQEERTLDARASLLLIEDEKRRRVLFLCAVGVAVLATVGVLLTLVRPRDPAPR